MYIEIAAPACLPLGIARIQEGNILRTCLTGVTLKFPPTHVVLYPSQGLQISGARARIATNYSKKFLKYNHLQSAIAVELELATPSHMGLCSDNLVGISMAHGLAWAYSLPMEPQLIAKSIALSPQHRLELHAFAQGGFLFIETPDSTKKTPGIIRRKEIKHEDKKDDWVFVLILPRVAKGTPISLETDLLSDLLRGIFYMDGELLRSVTDELWAALENDNIVSFGHALMRLQEINLQGLNLAGLPSTVTPNDIRIFNLMRENGAIAWGKSATGIALFGLIQGAKPSVDLRTVLSHSLSPFEQTIMASITDNQGVHYRIHPEDYEPERPPQFNFESS